MRGNQATADLAADRIESRREPQRKCACYSGERYSTLPGICNAHEAARWVISVAPRNPQRAYSPRKCPHATQAATPHTGTNPGNRAAPDERFRRTQRQHHGDRRRDENFDTLLVPPAATPTRRAPNVEDAWLFLHLLFELIWTYRFLYRDLNNLLINNRTLELRFQSLLENKVATARWLCHGLAQNGELIAQPAEIDALARNMVVITTYWLSYEYVLNPRHFAEPAVLGAALARGCHQVMSLTAPYLTGAARVLFERLASNYLTA